MACQGGLRRPRRQIRRQVAVAVTQPQGAQEVLVLTVAMVVQVELAQGTLSQVHNLAAVVVVQKPALQAQVEMVTVS